MVNNIIGFVNYDPKSFGFRVVYHVPLWLPNKSLNIGRMELVPLPICQSATERRQKSLASGDQGRRVKGDCSSWVCIYGIYHFKHPSHDGPKSDTGDPPAAAPWQINTGIKMGVAK